MFQKLDLDTPFDATALEESFHTVGKRHTCYCGYVTLDKSNFNKHKNRCRQATPVTPLVEAGPSTHTCVRSERIPETIWHEAAH